MNPFAKTKISTAVDKLHPFNLTSQHITTADFFQLSPIYIKELVPKTKILNASTKTMFQGIKRLKLIIP